jgi:exopolyphosphatase/guanosine-5'-triphosphate,3'-diphosphate pyrophosphatase
VDAVLVYAGRARPAGGWGRRRGGTSYRDVFAALDLGTNNCRLLIARPAPEGFRVIDAFSRIVRLGEGILASGQLSEPAIARTIEALRVCASKMRRRHVTRARAVATEACRRAGNCQIFIERVARETGLTLEIIPAREEAELALIGCAPLFDPAIPNALVFDIGGGSTEVAWLELGEERAGPGWPSSGRVPGAQVRALASLPFGVVTLAERYGAATGEPAGFARVVDEVYGALATFRADTRLEPRVVAGEVQMLGTSGTVTTLTGVHLDLPRYDRSQVDGATLEFCTIEGVTDRILAMTLEGRAQHPCIGQERADLVAAGCAILKAICRSWPVGRLRVADRGVREGILFNLMRRASEPAPRLWEPPA